MYHIDDEKVTLKDLKKRMLETDLVPSRASLLDDIENIFVRLEENGYETLSDLRKALKNAKKIPSVSKVTGIEEDHLNLLRREIESYFPKPFPLSAFGSLDKNDLRILTEMGLKDTRMLYYVLNSPERKDLTSAGVDERTVDILISLTDLTRVQWTNPTAAMMLLEAGYSNAMILSEADPDRLCIELERVNSGGRFFKGKIGLRDVKRLVKAASYLNRQ